jgi:RNA polymerase sigma factor (sigma-70 family)
MSELESLVRAAQAGDLAAFSGIVRKFQDMGYGCAYAILGDFHLAEDVTQEAFIEAYRNLPMLRSAAAFPAWFRRVVHYRCRRVTRARRLPTVPLEKGSMVRSNRPGPAQSAQEREMAEKVIEAIKSLPQPQRETVTLFYINGYSQKEIAEFLEVPVNTVKSRLHASRERLKERMIDMVEKVFDEHKLPDDFAGKVIEGVPSLAWGVSGNTTYIAGVSASLAVTDRPFDYDALMVYSGLAFRLRYVRRKDQTEWCTVGPVGQFEEEADAVSRATGYAYSYTKDVHEKKRQTVAALDGGHCPTAYIKGDTGVIYGYDDDGDTVLVRCFDLGEGFHSLPFEEVAGGGGPFFLEPTQEPLPPRDALIRGLLMGLVNWRRGRQPGEHWQPWREKGKWEYCFGDSAYEAWIDDLRASAELAEDAQKSLYRCHSFTSHTLFDARLAAGRFLSANADALGETSREHLQAAAGLYEQLGRSIRDLREKRQAFFGYDAPERTNDVAAWTPQVRRREIEVLTKAHKLDAAAIAEIDRALAEMATWSPTPV